MSEQQNQESPAASESSGETAATNLNNSAETQEGVAPSPETVETEGEDATKARQADAELERQSSAADPAPHTPEQLADIWDTIRQNWRILLKADTWQEISKEVPRRVKASLVLILVLAGLVVWVQSSFSPVPIAGAPPAPTLTPHIRPNYPPTATPAMLGSNNVSNLQSAPVDQPEGTPTPLFRFHTVLENETLISIAAQYGVTTEALLVANTIRNPEALETGQYLLIPPEDTRQQQKIIAHEIKEGDTLLNIASKYGSSVKDIQTANPHLGNEIPPVGNTLAIPIVFVTDNPLLRPQDSEKTVYHTVQPGEVPLSIAAQYDIPVDILLTANDITDPTLLQIGQQIVIPPHDGITLSFPVILYELQESDTLVGIASRFGSSVKDILAVNLDLDPANLQVGQLVAIPVIFAPPRPTPAPSDAPRPTPGPPPPALTDLNRQLVQAVNARREANGLLPQTFDGQLAEIALEHAQDMYVRDFFAHVNPDGLTLSDRLQAGDVNFIRAGENIQRNTQPRDKTVEAAINWFVNSSPHRANILHEDHNRIGVAVVEGPPGWYTFVLVFAER